MRRVAVRILGIAVAGACLFSAVGGASVASANGFGVPRMIADIPPGDASAYVTTMVGMRGRLLYSWNNERALMVSDGTAAGTRMIRRFESPTPRYITPSASGIAFFSAGYNTHRSQSEESGSELWATNGSTARLVRDISKGYCAPDDCTGDPSSNPHGFVAIGPSEVVFAARNYNGTELWKSNGTWAGTVMVRNIAAAVTSEGFGISSDPTDLTRVGSEAFFSAYTPANGRELWKSNATTVGTVVVHDRAGASSNPGWLTDVNGTLYFAATANQIGRQLWKSNGTAAGTEVVRSIQRGAGGAMPTGLVNERGTLFFTAVDAVHGRELWKSNGTAAGTVMVKDIRPGPQSSGPLHLTASADGNVYFTATDGVYGRELWKSNGTAAGTVLVNDIAPGAPASNPYDLHSYSGHLIFTAVNAYHNAEPWTSGGTTATTSVFAEIYPGWTGSYPNGYAYANNSVFFSAVDNGHGRELWVAPITK